MAAANSGFDVTKAVQIRMTALRELCRNNAARAEQIAKETAPWQDRTKEARKLLKGYVIDDGEALGIGLAHRVEYGKWLERDGDGKYAVLKPTIESMRAEFLGKAKEIMGAKK